MHPTVASCHFVATAAFPSTSHTDLTLPTLWCPHIQTPLPSNCHSGIASNSTPSIGNRASVIRFHNPHTRIHPLTFGATTAMLWLWVHPHKAYLNASIHVNHYILSSHAFQLMLQPPFLAFPWRLGLDLQLDISKPFHLSFSWLQLYSHIPITLHEGSTTSFTTPLEKLAEDPFDIVAWHFLLLFFQWCFIWPP